MSDKIQNLDELGDDEFMQALEDASYQEPELTEDENENFEDTAQEEAPEEEVETEPETNEQIDDEAQDSGEEDNETFDDILEENAQAENDSEVEPEDEAGSEQAENENENEESKDENEPEDTAEELNYKEEYAKLLEESAKYQDFYNQVTGEFVANGRKTKGFDDPQKIIKAQQMAAGYSEKMLAFKQYRPFMNALKEKGMLEDPEKFNFAMQLLEGDPEALKKQLQNSEIDPAEIDMDEINYVSKNQISSDIEIALDDVMETATQYGVDEQIQKIISNDWDDESVIELLEDPQNSTDLINHISTGVYDVVLDRMADKRRVDVNQVYTRKPKIEQYREAAIELEQEYMQYLQTQEGLEDGNASEGQPEPEANTQTEQAEWIGKIDNEQTKEYKAKVEKQNAKTNEARRKATSLSKKKRGTRKPKQAVDPLKLNDEDFTDFLDSMIQQA